MSQRCFQIHNREALRAEHSLLPFACYISRVLTSSGVVRDQMHETSPPHDGWIIFQGDGERGFGVRCDHESAALSPLQRALELVRCAHLLVKGFGGPRAFPFTLSLRSEPPESWRVCKVVGVVGTVWCGSSIPVLNPPARTMGMERELKARTRVVAHLPFLGEVAVGTTLEIEELAVWLPEIGIVGRCFYSGGDMTLNVEERSDVREQQVPGVRLDLGEIEVRLSDLVALRPGAVLDLGEASLERCYVRLGSTILAEGRFTSCDGKVTLTIESVV